MVNDHSDSERGNPLPPLHRLLFPISSYGSSICTTPQTWIAHTAAFVTRVAENLLEREIAQWICPTTHRTMSERSYHGATSQSYNNSMDPPWRICPTTHRTISERSYHGATSQSYNSSMGPPRRIDPTAHRTMSKRSYHGATSQSYNNSMDPPWRIDPTTYRTMSERSYHGSTSQSYNSSMDPPWKIDPTAIAPWANALTTDLHLNPTIAQWIHHERSIRRPSHHEQTLLPRSYISILQ